MKTILVVDNQLSSNNIIREYLIKKDFNVETTTKGEIAFSLLHKQHVDLIICDYRLPDMDGTKFFDKLSIIAPQVKVIFMSQEINFRNAINLVKRGAFNYLLKPLNPDELLKVIIEATNTHSSSSCAGRTNVINSSKFEPIKKYVIGRSKEAISMFKQVRKVGRTNYTVIIQGETGTGKESIARMIHSESPRRNHPFIAIDCGSLSNEISGSELFGHEKGSFTGAVCKKTRFFELAEGGTIFLDEISNLSLETQMALLRALQEKVIRKIGGTEEIPIDVRVIAATNENLRVKSETNEFREDLFFRLSEFVLLVPPLRGRKVDLMLFLDYFLESTATELNIEKPSLSQEVISIFKNYHWPGNIRELRNTIRRACLFVADDNYIYKDALPYNLLDYCSGHSIKYSEDEDQTNRLLYNEINKENKDLKSTANKAESMKIIEVLKEVRFNKTKAAEILNIHRKTLYTKLKMLNLDC